MMRALALALVMNPAHFYRAGNFSIPNLQNTNMDVMVVTIYVIYVEDLGIFSLCDERM